MRTSQPRRSSSKMAHADELQHDVLVRRRCAKMLVHRRRAASSFSMSSPSSAAGSRPTADSTENRPPTPSGTGNISRHPSALASSNNLPDRAGDRNDQLANLLGLPAQRAAQFAQQDAKRGGRLQRAAALADDDDAPAIAAAFQQPHQIQAARRCRRCCPRNTSAAGRAASPARPRCSTGGSTLPTVPAPPCTSRRCPARPRVSTSSASRSAAALNRASSLWPPLLRKFGQQPIRQFVKPGIERLLFRGTSPPLAHNCASASTSSRAAASRGANSPARRG